MWHIAMPGAGAVHPINGATRLAIHLAAVLDWFTRRVLTWRISITLEADFCIEAGEEALAKHGTPEIFNTDQGSQFTSTDFIKVLAAREIKISMDGTGAWRDNVFVERRALVRHWSEDNGRAADHQIRGGLPAGLRQRLRGPRVDRSLSRI